MLEYVSPIIVLIWSVLMLTHFILYKLNSGGNIMHKIEFFFIYIYCPIGVIVGLHWLKFYSDPYRIEAIIFFSSAIAVQSIRLLRNQKK